METENKTKNSELIVSGSVLHYPGEGKLATPDTDSSSQKTQLPINKEGMKKLPTHFKFSGRVSPYDPRHQVLIQSPSTNTDESYSPPINLITYTVINPKPGEYTNPQPYTVPATAVIAQYGFQVNGSGYGYSPENDCNGWFMSSKYQPNNNCYAYACDIATCTFPQPGRANGNFLFPPSGQNNWPISLDGPTVQSFAELDGLITVGKTIEDIKNFVQPTEGGHFVALMISLPGDTNWQYGDYHWARCDDPINFASWSQKDGNDQVTNFDFAGMPIIDPSKANWTVNQGPLGANVFPSPSGSDDLITVYDFYCFMYVTAGKVNII